MHGHDPDIQTIQISDVTEPFLRLVSRVARAETRIVVERDGEPIAALVSAEDLRRLRDLDRAWEERTRVIERFSQAFEDVPADEAEVDVARIIEERRKLRNSGAERQPA